MIHNMNEELDETCKKIFTDWLCKDYELNISECLPSLTSNVGSEEFDIFSNGVRVQSPVESIIGIYKYLKTGNDDVSMMNWLLWITEGIRGLSPECQRKCDIEEDRLNLEKSKERKEALQRQSQQRALDFISKANKAFMEQLGEDLLI